jgi:hypothetical protein
MSNALTAINGPRLESTNGGRSRTRMPLTLAHPAEPQPTATYPREEYISRLAARSVSLSAEERRHRLVGNVRVIVFLIGLAMGVALLVRGGFSAWWLAVPVIALAGLGTVLQRLEARVLRWSRAVEFYKRGLARLKGDWAGHGETGARFLDEHHLYAKDLDILGERSLFELLCAARTRTGEDTLAAWLLHPAPHDTVRARQRAVEEIAPRLDLREDLALAGENARSSVHADRLIAWGHAPPVIASSVFRFLAWILSAAGAVATVALIVYLISLAGLMEIPDDTAAALQLYVLTVAAVCLVVNRRFQDRTGQIIREVDAAAYDLGLLTDLLRRLERSWTPAAGLRPRSSRACTGSSRSWTSGATRSRR